MKYSAHQCYNVRLFFYSFVLQHHRHRKENTYKSYRKRIFTLWNTSENTHSQTIHNDNIELIFYVSAVNLNETK